MMGDIQHSRYQIWISLIFIKWHFCYSKVLSGMDIWNKSRYLPNQECNNTSTTTSPPLPFSQTRKTNSRQTFTLQCVAILQGHIKKNITRLNLIHCCQSLKKKRGETTWPTIWTWDPQWRLSYPQKIDSVIYTFSR